MAQISDLFTSSRTKTFKKNQVILTPQEEITTIFYILSGRIRMYSVAKSGQETTLHIFEPNSFLPIMIVLAGLPNLYYFEATEPTQVHHAPKDQVLDYLKKHPEELYLLTTRLSGAIMGLLTRIENLTAQPLKKQIASLKELSKKHNRSTKTHQEIANWLGVSRETVSRNS